MKDIKLLANQFRNAIDTAKNAGEFSNDFSFSNFPLGCCGDTCDLLAHFLLENGITTRYVYGTYRCGTYENRQSHAWLETKEPTIIDITGDQFKYDSIFLNYDKAVYVGVEDDFHRLFEVDGIHENNGIEALSITCQSRLKALYRKIVKYIY